LDGSPHQCFRILIPSLLRLSLADPPLIFIGFFAIPIQE
jgi:hypothetical protein